MNPIVAVDSLITLHYRVALADGTELVSTFDTTPATLQLGAGELAPTLEHCLIGQEVGGERCVFLLEPEQGFGVHNPQLMQRFPRSELPKSAELEKAMQLEFKGPGGAIYTGLVRELSEDSALIDFNHPLAGKAIRFEVELIGVL